MTTLIRRTALTPQKELVLYSDGTVVFEGYVSLPSESAARMPTLLLMHEWSGLNTGMRLVADRVASLGYVCFATDIYGKGVRGDEAGNNTHLMEPLLADRALLRKRVLTGLDAAMEHPSVDASRIGALGYCFGGLCALDLARAAPPHLRAAVSIHAPLTPPAIDPPVEIRAAF